MFKTYLNVVYDFLSHQTVKINNKLKKMYLFIVAICLPVNAYADEPPY